MEGARGDRRMWRGPKRRLDGARGCERVEPQGWRGLEGRGTLRVWRGFEGGGAGALRVEGAQGRGLEGGLDSGGDLRVD